MVTVDKRLEGVAEETRLSTKGLPQPTRLPVPQVIDDLEVRLRRSEVALRKAELAIQKIGDNGKL